MEHDMHSIFMFLRFPRATSIIFVKHLQNDERVWANRDVGRRDYFNFFLRNCIKIKLTNN